MSTPPATLFGLPIFHKYYAFIKALTSWQTQCPKTHRHTIGMTVVNSSHALLETFYRANLARGYKRLVLLSEASVQLDMLKIFIRLAKDTHAMSDKQYIHLQEQLNEVGKILGGWIKDNAPYTKRPTDLAEGDRGI